MNAAAVERALEAGDTGLAARERERRAGRRDEAGGARRDRGRVQRAGAVEREDLAGEVAVPGSCAAELVAGRVRDRVVVDQVQPERPVARPGRRSVTV